MFMYGNSVLVPGACELVYADMKGITKEEVRDFFLNSEDICLNPLQTSKDKQTFRNI